MSHLHDAAAVAIKNETGEQHNFTKVCAALQMCQPQHARRTEDERGTASFLEAFTVFKLFSIVTGSSLSLTPTSNTKSCGFYF